MHPKTKGLAQTKQDRNSARIQSDNHFNAASSYGDICITDYFIAVGKRHSQD